MRVPVLGGRFARRDRIRWALRSNERFEYSLDLRPGSGKLVMTCTACSNSLGSLKIKPNRPAGLIKLAGLLFF